MDTGLNLIIIRAIFRMEQHPVPQNVTNFQFRLIGDMTIKQFAYLAAGAVAAFIFYKLPLPVFFTVPLAAASALLGFGFAFVPIEERPMDVWVASFLKSAYSPTLYVWQKQNKPGEAPKKAPDPIPSANPPQPSGAASSPETQPSVGAITENHTQPKEQAPTPTPKTDAASSPGPWTTFGSKPAAPQPNTETPQPGPNTLQPHTQTPGPAPSGHQPQKQPKGRGCLLGPFGSAKQPPKTQAPSTEQGASPKAAPPISFDALPPKIVTESKPAAPKKAQDVFSNLQTPQVTGVKPEPDPEPATPPAAASDKASAAESAVHDAEAKSAKLEEKLTQLEHDLADKHMSQSRIIELQKQLTDLLSEKRAMQSELASLRMRLASVEHPRQAPQMAAKPINQRTEPTVRIITADTAVRAGLPKLTTTPNVVTGIIKDHTNALLPGVLVTVRDKDGTPVRALKTNKLGQFAASTPLPNGSYFIEIEDPRKRFLFDRAQITLSGNVAPAIEMAAKGERELSREQMAKDLFGSQQR